jgi:hypothetical protein
VKTAGRDVREGEWVALNGPIPVSSPRRIVRPIQGIGGIVSPATLSVEQVEIPDLTVVLDVTNPASPVNAYQWEVVEPGTDNVFNEQMRASYKIEGTCPDGVKSISVVTPDDNISQNFPFATETVSLDQGLIGTSRADVSDFCLDFAQAQSDSVICSQDTENCQSQLNTAFVGGPDGPNSMVELRMECQNGSMLEREFAPRLDLTCGLEPFGYLN